MAPAVSPRTVHIVDAHLIYPEWSEGSLTRALTARAVSHLRQQGHRVTVTTVEDSYDPEVEVQRHLDADLVVLQTPVNWFSAPWIYKRYVDEVFNAGLNNNTFMDDDGRTRSDPSRQYGTGGHMHGRGFLVSATWNAPVEAFDNPDGILFGGNSVDDVYINLTASYKFVGYEILKSYSIYDIFHNDNLETEISDFARHLDEQLAALAVATSGFSRGGAAAAADRVSSL